MSSRSDQARGSGPGAAFDRLVLLVGLMGVAVTVLAAVVAIRGGGAGAAPGGDPGSTAETPTARLVLTEFAIEGDLQVAPGPVQLELVNQGAIIHNLELEGGPVSPDLANGESAVMDLGTLDEGSYVVFCNIAGHREAGMEAILVVASDPGPVAESQPGHGDHADYAELDRAMEESILAFPAETEGKGNQPLQPTILDDGTKQFRLTAAITPWEVEPGRFVDAWTYNGMVPGPMIRVDVGDRVQVLFDNDLPMGTDIHWHGVSVPNDMDGVAPLTQELVMPGESFVYEFETIGPAIGMYHAHHHGQTQVPNGLFAPMIVGEVPLPRGRTISGMEIPTDLQVAHEVPMVLNDAGVIGLSLNGKSFPATEPYVGKVGDWVVAHYYNEGLQVHPMHQHQFPQLVFAKDGFPLEHPYWADTVNVAPGERYSVLYQLTDPGVWVWHCHILTHVERAEGMFGMVTAWIVEE